MKQKLQSGIFITRMTAGVTLLLAALLLSVFSLSAGSRSRSAATATSGQPPYTPTENKVTNGGLTLLARVFTGGGWVKPGETFPVVLTYEAGDTGATNATITVTLHSSAVFLDSIPAPNSGNGTSGSPLVFNIPAVAPNGTGQIAIEARAKDLTEDPEVIWKDISSDITLAASGQSAVSAHTHGPKVTTLETARYGDRPFPVVMVQYQDIKHCTDAEDPFPECTGNHTAEALNESINSRTSGKSLWQLYHDESFGQLYIEGAVRPVPNSADKTFGDDAGYNFHFSAPKPNGVCTGTTSGPAAGTPAFLLMNRIEGGWYNLPGTQGYYGADRTGHALLGAETGQGLLFGIDDACGPPGKLAYDAAAVADPDIDYNDFDFDKDGVVDFFNVVFAGDGGNGSTSATGLNNIWPHSSDLRQYFTDENGQTGYVSNDQFRNRLNQLVYWTDESRTAQTTTPTAFPVYVRVGKYNVNPEAAVESVSVIAHEYGHALGLPDYYSTGTRATMGSYDLNGTDYFQYHSIFSRQDLGWVVPQPLPNATVTLRESKFDTGEIHWNRPDGSEYVLSGPGIHNADAYRVGLPPRVLVDQTPSGTHAWYSQAGNDFGCSTDGKGHNLDFFLPDLQNYADASAVTLTFKHLYEMEWNYDYGFVLVSEDGGRTWTSLAATDNSTTAQPVNPNGNACQLAYGNGFTGVSDGDPLNDETKAATNDYSGGQFVSVQFDLTAYKGKEILLRFSYATDPGLAKRGWFIDDIEIKADDTVVYASDFETDNERTRIFPIGWTRVSSAEGAPQDHAYYLELRDRISNDFNGKGQSERGTPTFEGGLVLYYDDEAHGYGNFGVDDPPAITIVDAIPQPGNEAPNLDDATFNLARSEFNACTHIENYDAEPGPGTSIPWILPPNLYFKVTGITGMSAGPDLPATPATATLIADPNPVCSALNFAPPTLSVGNDYENPDTDGNFTLNWTRPANAVGPDRLEVATNCSENIIEDAESGLDSTKWDVGTEGAYAGLNWEAVSDEKPNHDGGTFRAKGAEGVTDAAAILTYKIPYAVPTTGVTTLEWDDWFVNEGDDSVAVEVSDNGTDGWSLLYSNNRSELANDATTAFANEGLNHRSVDLGPLQGKTVYFRFRYQLGPEDRAGSTPFGWYIDNIALNNSDWADRATVDGTSFTEHKPVGNYCYRVSTNFQVGDALIPSAVSNTVSVAIAAESPTPTPTPTPTPVVSVSVLPTSINEGQSATYTVSALAPVGQDTTVNYTMSGKAKLNTDYTLTGTPGQVTILAGQSSAIVTLNAVLDGAKEKKETAIMTLQPGDGYTFVNNSNPNKKKKKKPKAPGALLRIRNVGGSNT
jgi:M6 family metalloprotease-like protein